MLEPEEHASAVESNKAGLQASEQSVPDKYRLRAEPRTEKGAEPTEGTSTAVLPPSVRQQQQVAQTRMLIQCHNGS